MVIIMLIGSIYAALYCQVTDCFLSDSFLVRKAQASKNVIFSNRTQLFLLKSIYPLTCGL